MNRKEENQENRTRCAWVPAGDELYTEYHDNQWGKPVHDDHILFEMLLLEGMQAGLSWITILRKRENFRKAFDNFDIDKILQYDEKKIGELMQDQGIIRNRLKIHAVIVNAKAFQNIQSEYGSFDKFLWDYVGGKPIKNRYEELGDVPTSTKLSDQISKDLKKRGFKFVGSTIIYAYLQAVGVVNDHTTDCFLWEN